MKKKKCEAEKQEAKSMMRRNLLTALNFYLHPQSPQKAQQSNGKGVEARAANHGFLSSIG
jgi:hypothetical protein